MFGILNKAREAVSLAEKAIKNAEYWKGQAELWKSNLHRALASQDRFAKFLVTENARINDDRAHLEKVLSRKNRKLKFLTAEHRKHRRAVRDKIDSDFQVNRNLEEWKEQLEAAGKLADFMTMNGLTALGPIQARK